MWTRAGPTVVIILAVLSAFDVAVVAGQDTKFSFPSGFPDVQNLSFSADALQRPDGTEWHINMNAGAYSGNSLTSCGRVVYKDKVRLVDNATRTAASFKTSFTFSFESTDTDTKYCGDGMVFAFYSNATIGDREFNRSGGAFCVLDAGDLNPGERIFAVEIDSYYNQGPLLNDFSDSHIAVDFGNRNVSFRNDQCGNATGSHRCANQYNLCSNSQDFGLSSRMCSFFCQDKQASYTAWIDYDSSQQLLEVRFRNGSLSDGSGKPAEAVITVPNLRLDEFLDDENVYVGFTGSSGAQREVHTIKSWEFESWGILPSPAPTLPGQNPAPKSKSIALIAGISSTCAVVVAGLLCFCLIRHRKRPNAFKNLELISSLEATETSRAYTYRELSRATKNFSASELLSSGAFGDVYRGTLPSGALVAVKRIKENKEQGEESFLAEATSLRQIRHRNLLQLRGWSHSSEGLFLIYDFMTNGSLDKWIYRNPNPDVSNGLEAASLSWNVRRFILAGVASGLEYLHEEWVQCVLHRDIKSSNVMLDADFNAYLGDFGLARLIDHNKLQRTTLLAGTLGYMAPEMMHTGRATKETDVYAFGILVLEVVCGRRPLDTQSTDAADFVLLDRVWRAHEAGNISKVADTRPPQDKISNLEDAAMARAADVDADISKQGGTLEEKMMMANLLHLGLLCCLPNPSERPSMRAVNRWFQSSESSAMDELPRLPASKPHYAQYYPDLHSAEGTSSSQSLGFTRPDLYWSTPSDNGSDAISPLIAP